MYCVFTFPLDPPSKAGAGRGNITQNNPMGGGRAGFQGNQNRASNFQNTNQSASSTAMNPMVGMNSMIGMGMNPGMMGMLPGAFGRGAPGMGMGGMGMGIMGGGGGASGRGGAFRGGASGGGQGGQFMGRGGNFGGSMGGMGMGMGNMGMGMGMGSGGGGHFNPAFIGGGSSPVGGPPPNAPDGPKAVKRSRVDG